MESILEDLGPIPPADSRQDHVGCQSLEAVGVDGEDIGMGELGEGEGLALEALPGALVEGALDGFDDELGAALSIAGGVDDAHAAATEFAEELVAILEAVVHRILIARAFLATVRKLEARCFLFGGDFIEFTV